jgi:hypothetical protein
LQLCILQSEILQASLPGAVLFEVVVDHHGQDDHHWVVLLCAH